MKILIIGGNGFVGYEILKFFKKNNQYDVEFTYNQNKLQMKNAHFLDITKEHDVEELISEVNPDVVFHTAALTSVDRCEDNKELADLVNIHGTENIIQSCKGSNSRIVFISTSFVFNGNKSQYFEDDEVCPNTHYGQTKARAEKAVKNSGLSYQILRTDQPYYWTEKWHHSNSVLRCIDALKAGEFLREVRDWYNTPTYLPDFVKLATHLLKKDIRGIFHLVGSDFVSRFEWARKTANVFGLNRNLIIPISSSKLNLSAKRPNVNLSNEKVFEETGIKMRGIDEGLEAMKKVKYQDYEQS